MTELTQDTMAPSPDPNNGNGAKAHREKIFGFLSVEQLAQTFVFLALGYGAFVRVQIGLEEVKAAQAEGVIRDRETKATLNDHSTAIALQKQAADEQAKKTEVLFDGLSDNRKVLDSVNNKIDVLVGEMKPKP